MRLINYSNILIREVLNSSSWNFQIKSGCYSVMHTSFNHKLLTPKEVDLGEKLDVGLSDPMVFLVLTSPSLQILAPSQSHHSSCLYDALFPCDLKRNTMMVGGNFFFFSYISQIRRQIVENTCPAKCAYYHHHQYYYYFFKSASLTK